jgi:TM2 domain-containing membrane protein YozV
MWIPVILTLVLGPGTGQFYNKEYKKGLLLMGLSLLILMVFIIRAKDIFMTYLPKDVTTEDPTQLVLMLQQNAENAVSSHTGMIFVCGLAFLAVWFYGVVDSYKGGRRRAAEKKKIS